MTFRFWARLSYRLISYLLIPFVLGWLWKRGSSEPGYRRFFRERLGRISPTPEQSGAIWIHAASVGEIVAASALIHRLLQITGGPGIAISTNTPTGRDRVSTLWGNKVWCFYAPVDTPSAVCRVLERLRPTLFLTLEREIWPERLFQCQQRGIPTVLINARLSQKAWRQYRSYTALLKPLWTSLGLLTASDSETVDRFCDLGVCLDRIRITPSLKFDAVIPSQAHRTDISKVTTATTKKLAAQGRQLVVLGSSHLGDEDFLLRGYRQAHQRYPELLLVVVPRHPSRFNQVYRRMVSEGFRTYRTSDGGELDPKVDLIVVDQMGVLVDWYRAASLCIIGGTFANVGGHSPLEPLLVGQPILFGPRTRNAQSLFEDILTEGCGIRIDAVQPAWGVITSVLQDTDRLEELRQHVDGFVRLRRGAVDTTVATLRDFWPDPLLERRTEVGQFRREQDTVWVDRAALPEFDDHSMFSVTNNPHHARALTQGGRGAGFFLRVNNQYGFLRHYRRGGLFGRVVKDRYFGIHPSQSRAMEEFLMLRWARIWRLAVPRPLAARYVRGNVPFLYSADLITEEIPHSESIAARLLRRNLSPAEWRSIGKEIRRIHDRQIFHADLNSHNILICESGDIWVIDFDKAKIHSGTSWKKSNLDRLRRSLRKEACKTGASFWKEADWEALMDGYSRTIRPYR